MSNETPDSTPRPDMLLNSRRSILGKFVFYGLFCVGLGILGYMILSSGVFTNLAIFAEVSIPLILAAFLLTNANILVKVFRWKYLTRSYGADISWTDAGKTTIGSFFFSGVSPGKIGDLVKAYVMKNRYKVPFSSGVSMILYERVFELVSVFLVSIGFLFIGLSAKYYVILEASLFFLLFMVVMYTFSDQATMVLSWILRKIPLVRMGEEEFRFKKLDISKALTVFIITGAALGLEFVRLWTVAVAFGYNLNIIHLSVFFSLSVLIGLLSQIPIGIGVVEGSLAIFLTEAGVPFEYAFAIVIADRIVSMYYVILLGAMYYRWTLHMSKDEAQ